MECFCEIQCLLIVFDVSLYLTPNTQWNVFFSVMECASVFDVIVYDKYQKKHVLTDIWFFLIFLFSYQPLSPYPDIQILLLLLVLLQKFFHDFLPSSCHHNVVPLVPLCSLFCHWCKWHKWSCRLVRDWCEMLISTTIASQT